MTNKVTDETFLEVVGQTDFTLVVCSAAWCQPCKRQKPETEKFDLSLAQSEQPDTTVLMMDIDESPNMASHFKVASIPAFLWFRGRTLVEKEFGLKKAEALSQTLDTVKKAASIK